MKKVKIISDGTIHGTQVLYDGKPLEGITRIELGTIDAGRPKLICAKITFVHVDLELDAEIEDIDVHKGITYRSTRRVP